MVGGPEILGLLLGEWRLTRDPFGRCESDLGYGKSIPMMLSEASRDDGNVQFGISGGQDMFEQLPSLVVWI